MDPLEARLKFGIAIFIGLLWMLAVLLPVMIANGTAAHLPLWSWWLLAALGSYSLYTGIRAWRRGWTNRFILRTVIPLALLVISSILLWTGTWARLLS